MQQTKKRQPPKSFIEKCYKDKDGRVTLSQYPNAPIIVWCVCRVSLFFIAKNSPAFRLLDTVAFGALFTWAWLEVMSGANYARRALGAFVLIVIVINRV